MLLILLTTLALASASDWKSELKDSAWKEVIPQRSMLVGSGRVKRYIELGGKDSNVEPLACDLPDGKPGFCKPMQNCIQNDFKSNFNQLVSHLCILKNSKVGTCCPDTSKEFGSIALAGDLPATATKEENNDVLSTISRVENRGCGFSTRPRDQLIGSGSSKPREWPWMASITVPGYTQYCGGVLITDRHLLTAAHCFKGYNASVLEVRLGEYDFKSNTESRLSVFKVVEIIEHSEFDHIIHKNDITILKLHRPAVFNTYVWPICLPPIGLELVNKTTVIIGWGTVIFGGPKSPILQELAIPIWEQQKCIDSLTDQVFEENYCVGGYEGGKDACQFDSGSPLMYEMPSGRWAVIGLVSWGIRCGEPNHPGLYTRIDKYLPWIAANTQF